MAENLNKHQQMARTGKYEHFDKGGAVKGYGSHGHEYMHKQHVSHGEHGGKSIHHVHGGEVDHYHHSTENIGTDGGGKHEGGGGTGGTRNRI